MWYSCCQLDLAFRVPMTFSDCHSHFPRGMARLHVDAKFYAQLFFAMRLSAPRFSSAHGVPQHIHKHENSWAVLLYKLGLFLEIVLCCAREMTCSAVVCSNSVLTLPNWHLPVQCLWQPGSSAHARLVLWTIPRTETRNSLNQRLLSMKWLRMFNDDMNKYECKLLANISKRFQEDNSIMEVIKTENW